MKTKPAPKAKPAKASTKRGTCRKCGCTDNQACPLGCWWVDAKHTLCSACTLAGVDP